MTGTGSVLSLALALSSFKEAMAGFSESDTFLGDKQAKNRFPRTKARDSPGPCYTTARRLSVWLVLGTAVFFFNFAFFGAETLDGSAFQNEKMRPKSHRGFFSGVHYREFGLNDVATVPPKKATFLYVYEKNIHTRSAEWARMMANAELRTQEIESVADSAIRRVICNGSRLENSILLASQNFNTSVFTICAVRRMSLPRNVQIHPISSFNLDRDIVTAAFMEEKSVSFEKVNKSRRTWAEFKKGFPALSSLDVCVIKIAYLGLLYWCIS